MKVPSILRSIELIHYIRNLEKDTNALANNIQALPELNKDAVFSFLTGSNHQLQILDWQYKDFLKETSCSLSDLEACLATRINFFSFTSDRAKKAIDHANETIQLLYLIKNNKLRQVKIAERIKKLGISDKEKEHRFLLEESFI